MRDVGTPTRNTSSHELSTVVVDAVMRASALVALTGIAIIHLVQLVPTFQATPLLGAAFVALIAGTLFVGARLINPRLSPTRLWLPVLVLGAASLGGYVFTRVLSTPLDNQDVGNWSCMLGLAALFVEGTLVVLSAHAISVAPRHRRVAKPVTALNTMQTRRSHTHIGQITESRS